MDHDRGAKGLGTIISFFIQKVGTNLGKIAAMMGGSMQFNAMTAATNNFVIIPVLKSYVTLTASKI